MPTRLSHRVRALLLVALLSTSLLATAAAPIRGSAATERLELDSTHPLADEDAVEEYRETGNVSRNLTRLDAQLIYADDLEDVETRCGTVPNPGAMAEPGTEWLVLDYCEELSRELRINMPRGYFKPIAGTKRTAAGKSAVTYQPIDGRNATAIEVTVQQRGVIVIPVSGTETAVFGTFADWQRRIERGTNVSVPVPGLEGGTQWKRVDGETLGTRGSYPVEARPDEVLVQYRVNTSDGEEKWANVPDSPRDSVPVYVQERDGTTSKVWIVPRVDQPPDVRYKPKGDTSGFVGGVIDDLTSVVPQRLGDLLPF